MTTFSLDIMAATALLGIAASITLFALAVAHVGRQKKGQHVLVVGSRDTFRKVKHQIRKVVS